jgi:N-methylhydantoinase B
MHEVEPESYLYLWFERSVTTGWGLFGGRDAIGPDVIVDPGGGGERHLLKVNALPLGAGTSWELQTGGGGGFGEPFERDPERVRQDVLDGYVTREGAERDYGVALRDDITVDEEATARLRAS